MHKILTVPVIAALAMSIGCSKGSPEKAKTITPGKVVEGGVPIELQYVPEGYPMGLSVSQGFALHLFETPSQNQGFKKMPPEGGGKRYYDEFSLAGRNHLVVTEDSKPLRLYFDENRNGDLTDDRGPFLAEKEQFLPNNLSIQIRYDAEKVIVPYRVWLFSSNMGGVRFYPVCHWQGTLILENGTYPLVAFDGNADGDYSNDPVVIDANGNGKADEGEQLAPGKSINLNGKDVRLVSVSPSGLTVRLSW